MFNDPSIQFSQKDLQSIEKGQITNDMKNID